MSLIAHHAVRPDRAHFARAVAGWLLGGPPVRDTPARYAAGQVLRLCRQLPPPPALLAAADHLVDVELADADELAARLQADGLTRDVVPAAGLQRLIALWDVSVPDPPRLIDVSGRSILIGPRGQARLGELRARLRAAGGPVPAGLPPGRIDLAALVLSAVQVDEGLCPVTRQPPPQGLGRMVTRLLRAAPQDTVTILDAARNRSALAPAVPRPPADVLNGWLSAQPWTALDPDGTVRLAHGVVVDASRLDDTLLAELRDRERPTTAAELRAALHAAGYSAAGVRALLYMSPIPHRIPGRPGFYQLREASV